MRARSRWMFITIVVAGALLLTVVNWGIYRGGNARAGGAGTTILFPSTEFTCYVINHGDEPADTVNPVTLTDQFGPRDVTVKKPQMLCAPALKDRFDLPPTPLDPNFEGAHLKCYNITPAGPPPPPPSPGPPGRRSETLCDQFDTTPCTATPPEEGQGDVVQVQTAQYLCTLACKNGPFDPTGATGCITVAAR